MFDREFHIRFTLAQVGKALLLSPLVLLPAWGLMSLPWSSEHAPSWVQAVGSVAAIGVAILVASFQDRRRRHEAAHSEAELMKKVVALATHAGNVLGAAYEAVRDDANTFELQELKVGLEDNLALMSEITYGSIPGSEAAIGWIELRRSVKRTLASLREFVSDPAFGDQERRLMEQVVGIGLRAIARIRSSAEVQLPELHL